MGLILPYSSPTSYNALFVKQKAVHKLCRLNSGEEGAHYGKRGEIQSLELHQWKGAIVLSTILIKDKLFLQFKMVWIETLCPNEYSDAFLFEI